MPRVSRCDEEWDCGPLSSSLLPTFWVFLSLVIPMWREPLLMDFARFSCPIVMISFALNFGVKWYWVIVNERAGLCRDRIAD